MIGEITNLRLHGRFAVVGANTSSGSWTGQRITSCSASLGVATLGAIRGCSKAFLWFTFSTTSQLITGRKKINRNQSCCSQGILRTQPQVLWKAAAEEEAAQRGHQAQLQKQQGTLQLWQLCPKNSCKARSWQHQWKVEIDAFWMVATVTMARATGSTWTLRESSHCRSKRNGRSRGKVICRVWGRTEDHRLPEKRSSGPGSWKSPKDLSSWWRGEQTSLQTATTRLSETSRPATQFCT